MIINTLLVFKKVTSEMFILATDNLIDDDNVDHENYLFCTLEIVFYVAAGRGIFQISADLLCWHFYGVMFITF